MSMVTIVITFNQADASSSLYPVQLWHEGKPLVEAEVRLDRQRLLEREYQFSAHDYGMELFDAVFTGALGRAYQRLVGQAGAEGVVRVQLVIHPAAAPSCTRCPGSGSSTYSATRTHPWPPRRRRRSPAS